MMKFVAFFSSSPLSAAKLVNKLSFFTHIPPIEVNPFLGLRLAAAAAGVER